MRIVTEFNVIESCDDKTGSWHLIEVTEIERLGPSRRAAVDFVSKYYRVQRYNTVFDRYLNQYQSMPFFLLDKAKEYLELKVQLHIDVKSRVITL